MKDVHELPSSRMFSDRGFTVLQTERNAGDFMTFYDCWSSSTACSMEDSWR